MYQQANSYSLNYSTIMEVHPWLKYSVLAEVINGQTLSALPAKKPSGAR